ncbi:hypothetical protein BJ165DRAFT_445 [Panaeolus papilionaceus]|nr:hypothetical protein BJ165DRAFT_445 [Panaeolus papilionaceus]
MSTPNFPLSFLSHFPSLITLWITENYNAETPNMFFNPGAADRRGPSLLLERLHLDTGSISEGIFTVLKFFQDHTKRQGKKAFEGLRDLTVALANDDDLEGLKSVLGDGPRLKYLRVDGTIPPVVHSPDEGAWNSVSNTIYSLLSFVAGRNIVEVLTLNIQILFDRQIVPPPPAYWTQIAKITEILASSSKFPMIRTVSVEMDFTIANYTFDLENTSREENVEEGDMKNLQEQLSETFQGLATRLGSEFKLRVQESPLK